MKTKLFLALLVFGSTRLLAQDVWTDHGRLLPDQLRDIPTGIVIYHTPTPVWPETNTDTVNYPGKYIWKHSTRVNTEAGDLEVVSAGSYIWWKDKGWIINIQLDKDGFANRFHCENGLLQSGMSYTFIKNYRYGDALYAGDALWFVIAKDKKGNRYKGIALVETEGKLKAMADTPAPPSGYLRQDDLNGLTGKKWTGNLVYLDYSSKKQVSIPTELLVTASSKGSGIYIWATAYPKETNHNRTDEILISQGGKIFDDESVKTRMVLPDGTLKFITSKTGDDDNRPAIFRITYLIGQTTFSRKKEVSYDGGKVWITRNELTLKTN